MSLFSKNKKEPEVFETIVPEKKVKEKGISLEQLYMLGKMVRKLGKRIPKQHGNYWRFDLFGRLHFWHDDFNDSVFLVEERENGEDVTLINFGIDFGRFESECDREQAEKIINGLKLFFDGARVKPAMEILSQGELTE